MAQKQNPRPAAAGQPIALSDSTRATPALRIPIGVGHVYREKATGRLWTIAGMRSGRTVILVCGDELRDRVSVDATLPDEYEHAGCDHDSYCCALHGTHVDPHRGCVLR